MKRIGRISNGERVIVPIISEPLQEQYEQMDNFHEEVKDMVWAMQQKMQADPSYTPTVEERKAITLAGNKHERNRMAFWEKVQETYNTWSFDSVGLRDGFVLVSIPEKDNMKNLKEKFDKFIRNIGFPLDHNEENE